MTLALELESSGQAVEVFDGFWILATRHRSGGFKRFPETNNRAIVLRLIDAKTERPGLAVFNATQPEQSFPEIHRLRKQTGLDVTHVVSCGGGHHMFMGAWHEEFASAALLLGAQRVPRTTNGLALVQLPRVTVMDPTNPLPQFEGQLDALSFTGLVGAREFESPIETGRDSLWQTLKAMRHLMAPKDPYDELWMRHVASQTVIGGENLAPYFTKAAQSQMALMTQKAVLAEVVAVQTQARKVGDPQAVARCWEAVCGWPARNLLNYHDSVGGGFTGDVAGALRKAAISAGQLPA